MRQHAEDLADLRQEPHVEHAIGFVEHEVLDLIEPRVRRAQVIEQPAGRRDDDVDAAAKRVLLRPVADAAEHGRAGHRRVRREILQVFENLRRQLARGREHERARAAARRVDQSLQDRQQKRRGLAAAGLRAGDQVAAGQRRRNRFGLNGGGTNEAQVLDAEHQTGVQLERGEGQ